MSNYDRPVDALLGELSQTLKSQVSRCGKNGRLKAGILLDGEMTGMRMIVW